MPKKLKKGRSSLGRTPLHEELHSLTYEGQLQLRKSRYDKKIRLENVTEKELYNDPQNLDRQTTLKILDLANEESGEGEEAGVKRGNTIDGMYDYQDESEDEFSDDIGDNMCYEHEEIEVDPEDEEIFQKLAPAEARARECLSSAVHGKVRDIMEKIGNENSANTDTSNKTSLDQSVIDVYTKVGAILSRYKSGKLPKVFKTIPYLHNWRDIIYLCHPENWTPQATFAAVKIFISNFKPMMICFFLRDIILERIRDDIQANKKLNYHFYMALKKIGYNPAGLFKGIILPLCASGTCTLREASIIGSVISKISIPALHAAAGLLRLAEMKYSGASSLFIRIILDKRYALPYKVIDLLCHHFMRMKGLSVTLPVLWHQSLLVFVERHKDDLTLEQKDMLLDLIKVHNHRLISPEIHRELINSKNKASKESSGMDWQYESLPQITFAR